MSATKEEFVYLPSKDPTSFDKGGCMQATLINCCVSGTAQNWHSDLESVGGGTLGKISRMHHPIKDMFGTSPNLSVVPAMASAMWMPQSLSVQSICGLERSEWEAVHDRVDGRQMEEAILRIPRSNVSCWRCPTAGPKTFIA